MAILKYPERLLQPWPSLARFAEELYAMFRVAGADTDIAPAEDPAVPTPPAGDRVARLGRDETRAGLLRAAVPQLPAQTGVPAEPPSRSRALRQALKPFEPARKYEAPGIADRRVELSRSGVLPERIASARTVVPQAPVTTAPAPPLPPPATVRGRPAPPPQRPQPGAARRDLTTPAVESPRALPAWGREYGLYTPGGDDFALPPFPAYQFEVPGGGGTAVTMGRVISHTSGEPARVMLLPLGPTAPDNPDAAVDVTIPTLRDGETLPPGLILEAVHATANGYYSQPPIWLD